MRPPQGIMETVIYAADLEAMERFYTEIFGLEVVRALAGQFTFFRCGQQMLLIFNAEKSRVADTSNPVPRHGTTGAGHFCFKAENKEEVDAWRDHFTAHGIEIEHYQRWKNGRYSVYIRDPAGNSVEVGEARMWDADE